jgi:tetratricopeptide (TPR) repeat protein
VLHADLSPDGRRLATASEDASARVWDVATGEPLTPPLRHGLAVLHVAFSPDGRWVVTASADSTARVWDAATGQPLMLPWRHDGIVTCAAFSPDGRRVVTASDDAKVRVWDLYPDRADVTDMALLASVLSGQHVSPTAGALPSPLTPERYHDLRQRAPGAIAPAPAEQVHAWRRYEAEASARTEDWYAVVFHLDHAILARPDEGDLYRQRGFAHAHLGHEIQSDCDYARADARQAVDRQAWDRRAKLYARRGQYARAANDFARGIAVKTWSHDNAWGHLALTRLAARDLDGYRRACVDRHRFDKDDFDNSAAWMCCLGPRALPDLAFVVKRARQEAEKHEMPEYLNTLGAALYRAGEYRAAVQMLNRAIEERGTGTAHDWLFLAMAHHRLKQPDQAKGNLEKAVKWIEAARDVQPGESEELLPPNVLSWSARLELTVLRREAEEVLQEPAALPDEKPE